MVYKKIKETLELYKVVFLNNIDPAAIFDGEGKISYASKALLETSSYSLNELEGREISILISESERPRIKTLIEELINKKKLFRDFNTFFLTKGKKEIPIALSLIPLVDGNIVRGGLAVFVDIRQLQGLLDSLEKAKVELEERVKERTKDLELAKKQLEEAKEVLEIKVKARTKELKELNESLEEKVRDRTRELQDRIEELDKWYRLTVGRELKMAELKEEIEEMKKKISKIKKKK